MSMQDTLSLPTTRDEDWRYSDGAYLAAADPQAINHWRTLDVPAGETRGETFVFLDDVSATERLRVNVGAGGTFRSFAIIAGGEYRRLELEVTLADGAHFEFGGVTVGGGDAVQEFVTRVIHAEPNGTSNQVVRSVQWGKSTGNFLGRIEVVKDAQKTDAGQNFRALLLEKGATANTKPELEIFADDVKCAHGAAIGALDDSAAFYMAARGLPPEVAKRLLVQAFIGDAFAAMDDDDAREAMVDRVLEKLGDAV